MNVDEVQSVKANISALLIKISAVEAEIIALKDRRQLLLELLDIDSDNRQ